eukprot:gene9977-11000_t
MDSHCSDDDDIVKVEMQDVVYPATNNRVACGRQTATGVVEQSSTPSNVIGENFNVPCSRRFPSDNNTTGRQPYEHINNMADQSAISVEQRAAAIMDRIKQAFVDKSRRQTKPFHPKTIALTDLRYANLSPVWSLENGVLHGDRPILSLSFRDLVKQRLYYIDEDPERKEFLDDYFDFMRKRDSTVTRIPTMAKQPLDLFKLYRTVVSLGGLTEVVRNRHWSKVTRELNLPSSITSAAFTLRTQYLRFLYAYECFQKGIEEQPWKLDDCDDMSNGSFRATQASPSSFVENRTCPQPRDMRNEQRLSPPQWPDEPQLMCNTYGPPPPPPPALRPPFNHAHAHSQITMVDRGPSAMHNGFGHTMDYRCPEFAVRQAAPKMPQLTNGQGFEPRAGPMAVLSSHVHANCDCGKGSSSYNGSPRDTGLLLNVRKSGASGDSSPLERQDSQQHETTSCKESNNKDDNSDKASNSNSNDGPPDISMGPSSTNQERAGCDQNYQPHTAIVPESASELRTRCHTLPPDLNHHCQSGKDEPQDHQGRMPFNMNGATPTGQFHYSRSPYCNPRKRPRFHNQNGPSIGGCGCGRGEVLKSSDPISFKIHYRTEQRVFVTVQFGKRMYLGELCAEDLE